MYMRQCMIYIQVRIRAYDKCNSPTAIHEHRNLQHPTSNTPTPLIRLMPNHTVVGTTGEENREITTASKPSSSFLHRFLRSQPSA